MYIGKTSSSSTHKKKKIEVYCVPDVCSKSLIACEPHAPLGPCTMMVFTS